jgi:hypothetical protein
MPIDRDVRVPVGVPREKVGVAVNVLERVLAGDSVRDFVSRYVVVGVRPVGVALVSERDTVGK